MQSILSYCKFCKKEFPATASVCPVCGRPMKEKIFRTYEEKKSARPRVRNLRDKHDGTKEGEGRRYRTGGIACDMCPFCHGTRDWCPIVD